MLTYFTASPLAAAPFAAEQLNLLVQANNGPAVDQEIEVVLDQDIEMVDAPAPVHMPIEMDWEPAEVVPEQAAEDPMDLDPVEEIAPAQPIFGDDMDIDTEEPVFADVLAPGIPHLADAMDMDVEFAPVPVPVAGVAPPPHPQPFADDMVDAEDVEPEAVGIHAFNPQTPPPQPAVQPANNPAQPDWDDIPPQPPSPATPPMNNNFDNLGAGANADIPPLDLNADQPPAPPPANDANWVDLITVHQLWMDFDEVHGTHLEGGEQMPNFWFDVEFDRWVRLGHFDQDGQWIYTGSWRPNDEDPNRYWVEIQEQDEEGIWAPVGHYQDGGRWFQEHQIVSGVRVRLGFWDRGGLREDDDERWVPNGVWVGLPGDEWQFDEPWETRDRMLVDGYDFNVAMDLMHENLAPDAWDRLVAHDAELDAQNAN